MVFPLSRLAARMRAIGTEHTGNEGKKVMRIVLIAISHWHTPFYSDPVLGMKNATIVGVSDPDAERAAPLAAQAKCPVFTYPASRNSSRHLVAATRRPDGVRTSAILVRTHRWRHGQR